MGIYSGGGFFWLVLLEEGGGLLALREALKLRRTLDVIIGNA